MASILYYSNFCQHSKRLLAHLSKTSLKDKIHFVNIDNRYTDKGKIYILLPNGSKLSMPPHITKVPALMLINNYSVKYGEEIYRYLKPKEVSLKNLSHMNNGEPLAFSAEMASSMSDNYSFLDMSTDELSAKGDGGFRQMHHFAKLNDDDTINTPAEDYEPNKVKEVDLQKLQEKRNQDINF